MRSESEWVRAQDDWFAFTDLWPMLPHGAVRVVWMRVRDPSGSVLWERRVRLRRVDTHSRGYQVFYEMQTEPNDGCPLDRGPVCHLDDFNCKSPVSMRDSPLDGLEWRLA